MTTSTVGAPIPINTPFLASVLVNLLKTARRVSNIFRVNTLSSASAVYTSRWYPINRPVMYKAPSI